MCPVCFVWVWQESSVAGLAFTCGLWEQHWGYCCCLRGVAVHHWQSSSPPGFCHRTTSHQWVMCEQFCYWWKPFHTRSKSKVWLASRAVLLEPVAPSLALAFATCLGLQRPASASYLQEFHLLLSVILFPWPQEVSPLGSEGATALARYQVSAGEVFIVSLWMEMNHVSLVFQSAVVGRRIWKKILFIND
jgi:hypothetical protein